MDLSHKNRHKNCYNCEYRKKPQVEVVKIVKCEQKDLSIIDNEIVFIIEGRIKLVFDGLNDYEGLKGQFLFFPAGSKYPLLGMSNAVVIVFRFEKAIMFCENFKIEDLYNNVDGNTEQLRGKYQLRELIINPHLWHFLSGICDSISYGIKCHYYFEIKIKELLFLLRASYSKEELHEFFFPILSRDTVFSEYIRLRWQQYRTIKELADSMHLTHKQFYRRFISVFGKTPQQWIIECKTDIIYTEITTTTKQLKQIAFENGFSSDAQFSHFCKRMLGEYPKKIREGKFTDRGKYSK